MGMLSRLRRVVRCNIEELLEKAENPEKMLKILTREMEENFEEAKEEVAGCMAQLKKLQMQSAKLCGDAEKWDEKAKDALNDRQDEKTKTFIERKLNTLRQKEALEAEAEKQTEDVAVLKETLKELQKKIHEAKLKKDVLTARRKITNAQQTLHARGKGIMKTKEALEHFERMEDKITTQSLALEAKRELEKDMLAQDGVEMHPVSEKAVILELERLKETIRIKNPAS